MSPIRVNIDRLVLKGFEQLEAKALVLALRAELSRVLANDTTRSEFARSHHTPVLNLGRMSLHGGTAGASKLGKQMAKAVGKRLRP